MTSTAADRLRLRLAHVTEPADGMTGSQALDALEWVSRWITLVAYVIAVMAFVAAPILALSWSHRPFPGFTVEPTLVSNDTVGTGWSGREAGLQYPMHLVRVDGVSVTTSADLERILSAHAPGETLRILVQLPSGGMRLFPALEVMTFPAGDLARLFWVPYLVGLAYLLIGVWIYSLRGRTRPGRALAFFCVSTALACGLLFDLSTTHDGGVIWTLAVSQLGGALISLALRFPEEWRAVHRKPWLLGLPYAVSIGLGLWGIYALIVSPDPWAYIDAWGYSYRFAGLGAVVFLATTVYHVRRGSSPDVRRQARIVLSGSGLAFIPMVAWFLAPLLGINLAFSGPLLLLPLLLFPLSISVAILRYRLWDVDRLVSRTLAYATLTAVLAGLYTASIGLSQRLFVAVTGEKSDAAIVMTTLIVAAAFTPAKTWLQAFVDRRFKDERRRNPALSALREQVRAFAQVTDARRLATRLLEEAARDMEAASGSVSLTADGRLQVVARVGDWRGDARLSLPLETDGQRVGLLQLGPRQDERPYTRRDLEALHPIVEEVACAIGWAERVCSVPPPGSPAG